MEDSAMVPDDLPVIPFPSAAELATWLDENHSVSPGLWLKIAKKASGIATVTYAEALSVALQYGWIDGQKRGFDETWFLQRFTPRRPKSKWSQVNREAVTRLIEQGLMKPAGLAAVGAAKADGRWDAAYPSQSSATVPEDLRQALDANDAAREHFATLSSVNRYAILYRIHCAKKPETRVRNIEKFVAMLAEGKQIHP
jgi:uncharacterized protein YdeI (YjbR/CyaY-like superfamily)